MEGQLFLLDLDDTVAQTTGDMQGNVANLKRLTLVPGVAEFLAEGRRCILVTHGDALYQWRKLLHLGITSCFEMVVVLRLLGEKIESLAQIVQDSQLAPADVIVIGDRLDGELLVGRALGCTTVRVRLPKGKYSSPEPEPGEAPTHTVTDFHEIRSLFPAQ